MTTRSKAAAKTLAGCILLAAIAASPAHAYRPFDSTDASVADEGEFELELGPVGRLREGGQRSWIAPAAVANWGLAGDREVVLEGKVKTLAGDLPRDGARTSLGDTVLSLKQLHRRGSLQDGAGLSVASECGILLPAIHGESGTGATCAAIASQRWRTTTIHLNAALTFGRNHRWSRFFGAIAEGPYKWAVRPVAEVFTEQEVNGGRTKSALIGLIWRKQENLSFDVGLRSARTGDQRVDEVRAGLTWATSFGQ